MTRQRVQDFKVLVSSKAKWPPWSPPHIEMGRKVREEASHTASNLVDAKNAMGPSQKAGDQHMP